MDAVEGFRLSPQQETVWRTPSALLACTVRIAGDLTESAVRGALEEVVHHNEMLRAGFRSLPAMPLPLQVIDPVGRVMWRRGDRSDLEVLSTAAEAERGAMSAVWIPLQFGQTVLRLSVHPLVADARSMVNVVAQIAAAIGGDPARPLSYLEFAEWRRQLAVLEDEESRTGAAYWRRHPAPSAAPWCLTGHDDQASRSTMELPGAGRWLDAAAARAGANPQAVLLTAWSAVLARLHGAEHAVVDTVFDGRRFAEFAGSVGPFSSRHPVRVDFGRERLDDVTTGVGAILDGHRDWLEFAHVGERARYALSYVEHAATFSCPGATLTIDQLEHGVEPGVRTLSFRRAGDDAHARVDGCGELGERLLGYLARVLEDLAGEGAREVAAIGLLSPAERADLLEELSPPVPGSPPADESVARLFERQAALTPQATAVSYAGGTITYAELRQAAAAVAGLVLHAGALPGDMVALRMEHSPEAVAAILGILWAGATYLPIDPKDPPARQTGLLADSGAVLLLTGEGAQDELPGSDIPRITVAGPLDEAAGPAAAAHDPAYVIYTSGTTGHPKGVAVGQHSLVNYLRWVQRNVIGDVVLPAVSRLTFDASLKQILGPLLHGGEIWLLDEDVLADPQRLFEAMCERSGLGGAIGFNGVPTLWRAIVQVAEAASPQETEVFRRGMRLVLLGGEALPGELLDRTRALLPQAQVWNLYGPTETTANSTAALIKPGQSLTIGVPVDHTQVLLLDRDMRPVPVGVPGDLYIGGWGVAMGYLGRPRQTADRFLPNPYTDRAGDRIYYTGDIGRYLPDGRIEYLGRDDLQVKMNGFRIEIEGVEAALRELPGLDDAAVTVDRSHAGGADRLVAFVVTTPGAHYSAVQTRVLLAGRLPAHAIPAVLVRVPAIPRTSAGKPDRQMLAALPVNASAGTSTAQRSLVAEELAGLWSRLLKRPSINLDDDFFGCGGHSLLAIQMLARVQDVWKIRLPARSLFTAPTLRAFAGLVEEALAGTRRSERPLPVPRPVADAPIVSRAQHWALLFEALQPGARRHRVLAARTLRGRVDEEAVRRALATVIARHEILRTGFRSESRVHHPEIHRSAELPFTLAAEGEAGLQYHADQLLEEPFDLSRPPLMRARLVHRADGEAVLMIALHRAICDGWSKVVLFREFAVAYEAELSGTRPELPEVVLQYADFAAWEHRALTPSRVSEQLAHWRERLTRVSPAPLPSDRRRSTTPSHCGHTLTVTLSISLTEQIRQASMSHGVTPFMTLLAALAVLACRGDARREAVLLTPVTSRTVSTLENVMGPMVNTVALRLDTLGEPTFATMLARTREAVLAAREHQDVKFEDVVEELMREGAGIRAAISQIMFTYATAEAGLPAGPGTVLEPLELDPGSLQHDLELHVVEHPDRLTLHLTGDRDLFDEQSVRRMLSDLEFLLATLTEAPALPISAAEHGQRPDWLVARHARTAPRSPAVRGDGETLTYLDLDQRADRLARRLREHGVDSGAAVALCLGRGVTLVVAVLAVLRLGAVAVPLDPDDPDDHVRRTIQSDLLSLVVCDPSTAGALPAGPAPIMLLDFSTALDQVGFDVQRGQTAGYVVRTVGRDEAPAVLLETAGLLALGAREVRPGPGENMLTVARVSTGRFAAGMFATLAAGGCLVMPPESLGRSPEELIALIEGHRVTHLMCVPTLYGDLLRVAEAGRLTSLRVVEVVGERLGARLEETHEARLPRVELIHRPGHTDEISFSGRPFGSGKGAALPVVPPMAFDLEAALERHPGVTEALVSSDGPEGPLVVHVVPHDGGEVAGEELMELARRLSSDDRGVSAIILSDRLPRTDDGALDRRVMREPLAGPEEESQALARRLAAMWAEEFDVSDVGWDDNFFALGGHSILALQLLSRVEDEFDVELPVPSLFQAPTVNGMAEALEAALRVKQAGA